MKTKLEDKELEGRLSRMDNAALRVFADLLVYNNENQPRKSEKLTSNRLYKLYYPGRMNQLIPVLMDEFQHFGGNTIANIFRGHGVTYEEILKDICSKFNVKTRDTYTVETLEMALIDELLETILEKMDKPDLLGLVGDLEIEVSVDSTKNELCDKLRKVFHDPTFILVVLKYIIGALCPKVLEFSEGEQTYASDKDKEGVGNVWGVVGATTISINAARLGGVLLPTMQVVARLVPALDTMTTVWFVKVLTDPNENVTIPCTLFLIFQRIRLSIESKSV